MSILALDLGTSSVRGLVLDDAAVPLPGVLARRPVEVAVDDGGAATLDAAAYLAALVDCVDELHAAGRLDGVRLVSASSQWHSAVPLDRAGAPLGPLVTWLDTRPTPAAGATGPTDPRAFHQRTGAWWHRFYWTVKLPWLRAWSGPGLARFTGLPEFVLGALLTEAPMSVSQASGTGLLDLARLDWDEEALAIAGVTRAEVPPLAPAGWRGRARQEYARRWPALADVPWAPATGDGAASNVGTGCVDPTRAAVTVGTSAAVRLVQPVAPGAPLPPLPESVWRYRVDHERIVTGAAYSAGGNLFAWARKTLQLPEGEALERELSAITPGRTEVRADPRLGGDRPPGTAPAGAGTLAGLAFSTTPAEIFAGLMDGVCAMVARDLATLESTVDGMTEVVLGGGAVAAQPWWRRAFQAALAPRAVRHVDNPEVGATGAALLAAGLVPAGR
ncbi:FGGY family carbohydrate kinase [Phytohabitans sp. ZYX-F-186]|uniref:FGGY family carbohydrate kinase n=1 Tax=Phytohabitans maris TaxID=3071409 RepID=A0ABU0ZDH3_9ACTN|nr:FGGY family carbohydrate kinase [Phytohabitans sp. ZYX-F-186]MDQ7904370.1 FGGY family carbohydrate kinase [Phytohabitans sp. ZYX-F-186]